MKGMATEQVVLLVLAIIVLAVVGYLVYNQFVKGNKSFTNTSCGSATLSACVDCKGCRTNVEGTWNSNAPGTSCEKICKFPTGCFGDSIPIGYVDQTDCNNIGVN